MENKNLFSKNNEEIELEFAKMEASKPAKSPRAKATGIRDVLQFLLDHPDRIWWWSWEFNGRVNSKGDFLSHRACARASDLAIHHGEFVEDRKIGRFKVYRLRQENMAKIKEFLGI